MEGLFGVRAVCNELGHIYKPVLTNKDAAVPSSTTCAKSEDGQRSPSSFVLLSWGRTHLRCDERVRDQTPKEGRNSAGMESREDGEEYGTLLEDRASR